MEPLTIALAAGAGYLLLRGKGAAGVANMSIEQLAAVWVGKPVSGTPSEVERRFVDHFNAMRASGAEGFVVHGIDPAESARIGPTWNYIVGRLPGPIDPAVAWTHAGIPGLVWRRTDVKKKVSGIGAVLGAIGSLAGGVVKTTVLPGSGGLPL